MVAIVVGVAVRVWVLSQRGSLFLDEALLALNVLARDFRGLTQPLDWAQAAPIGFLWATRALTVAMGPGEVALRIVPFVAGSLAVAFTWLAGRRLATARAAALATVALACSLIAIRYSAEAKPYASDACATLVIAWLAARTLEQPRAWVRWAALGVSGVLAVCVSLPTVFVLAAAGLALARAAWRGGRATRAALVACVGAWLATFGALWFGGLRSAAGATYLRENWGPVMLDPSAADFPARVIRALASVVATALQWTGSLTVTMWAILALLVGLIVVSRRSLTAGILLGGPLAAAALASVAGMYPLSDRLAHFASPLALIAAATAVDALLAQAVGSRAVHTGRASPDSARHRHDLAIAGAAALLAAWVGRDGWRIVHDPGALEPTHALFTSVRTDARRTSTPVYVFARAIPAWVYVTTDWRSMDHARFDRYLRLAGPIDGPAQENLARPRAVAPDEGDSLVYRDGSTTELLGLAPGVRYRVVGPMSADGPSPGWADEEAGRLAAVAHPAVWLVASHFFEGTVRDELRPLTDAARARGLRIAEERRGGRDAVALRLVAGR